MGLRMNIETLEFEIQKLSDFSVGADEKNASGVDPHFHPYWELKTYLDEGRPRMVMTPPDTPHTETHRALLATGWVLHCREPMLNLSFGNASSVAGKDFLLSWKNTDTMCPGGITGLLDSLARMPENGDLRLLNGMQTVLWSVVSLVWRNSRGNASRALSVVDMAKYHIERNYYQSTLSVEDVAAYVGVTSGHLANSFKKAERQTVRGFLIDTRMNHALRLLRSGRHTVGEVAEMTGWSCQFYFSNCFRKRFGVAPSKAAELIDDENSIVAGEKESSGGEETANDYGSSF
jgi:AraC-like DNA-binding protein